VTGRLWSILPTVLISCLVVPIFLDCPLCWQKICRTWLGLVTYVGEKRNAYRIVVGKSERKKPLLGRLRYRHEDDNKMDYG